VASHTRDAPRVAHPRAADPSPRHFRRGRNQSKFGLGSVRQCCIAWHPRWPVLPTSTNPSSVWHPSFRSKSRFPIGGTPTRPHTTAEPSPKGVGGTSDPTHLAPSAKPQFSFSILAGSVVQILGSRGVAVSATTHPEIGKRIKHRA